MPRRRLLTFIIDARDRTGKIFDAIGKKLKGLFSLRNVVASTGLAVIARQLFDIGVEAEETQSRFSTLMGSMTEEMEQFARTYGVQIGVVNREAQSMLATSAQVLQFLGFQREAAAETSKEIFRLAGDIASFSDVEGGAARVADALNKALVGEREQLKLLGIVLREDDVLQQALTESGKESVRALTVQEKAVATLTLAYQQAGVAVGDVDRRFDSTQNRVRRISARFQNLRERIAVSLLPVFSDLIGVLERNSEVLLDTGKVVVGIVKGFELLIGVIRFYGVVAALAIERTRLWIAEVRKNFADMVGTVADALDSIMALIDRLPDPVKAFLGFGGPGSDFTRWARDFQAAQDQALSAAERRWSVARQVAEDALTAIGEGGEERAGAIDEATEARIRQIRLQQEAAERERQRRLRGSTSAAELAAARRERTEALRGLARELAAEGRVAEAEAEAVAEALDTLVSGLRSQADDVPAVGVELADRLSVVAADIEAAGSLSAEGTAAVIRDLDELVAAVDRTEVGDRVADVLIGLDELSGGIREAGELTTDQAAAVSAALREMVDGLAVTDSALRRSADGLAAATGAAADAARDATGLASSLETLAGEIDATGTVSADRAQAVGTALSGLARGIERSGGAATSSAVELAGRLESAADTITAAGDAATAAERVLAARYRRAAERARDNASTAAEGTETYVQSLRELSVELGTAGDLTADSAEELASRMLAVSAAMGAVRESTSRESVALATELRQLAALFGALTADTDVTAVLGDRTSALADELRERQQRFREARREQQASGDVLAGEEFASRVEDVLREAPQIDLTPVTASLQVPEAVLTSWGTMLAHIFDARSGIGELVSATGALEAVGGTLAEVWGEAFVLIGEGGQLSARAFGDAFQEMFRNLALTAGKFYAGKALAALGEGFLGHPGAFASAAKFAAASAAFFALAGAIGGGAGAAGGAGAGAAAQAGGIGQATFGTADREAVVVVEGGLLDMSDPRQADAFGAALSNLAGRRVIVVPEA